MSRFGISPFVATETDIGAHILIVEIVYNAIPAITEARRSLGTWMEL